MALFKKDEPVTHIPELQDYYATQQTQSTAGAWLLAVISLVITGAVIVGLFFGGRWLYRKGSDKKAPVNKPTSTTAVTESRPNTDTSSAANQGTVTAPTTQNGISNAINGAAPGVSPQQTTATNTAAKPAVTNIPNTGPSESVALFIFVLVLAYAARIRTLAKR